MGPPVYFFENLTLQSWVLSFWLRLLRERGRRSEASTSCYYFEASWAGLFLARVTAWIVGAKILELAFTQSEVKDDAGLSIQYRTTQDMFQVKRHAMNQQVFQEMVRGNQHRPRLLQFFAKTIVISHPKPRHTAQRALFLSHVCAWETKRNHPAGSVPLFFVERIPWLNAVKSFTDSLGVNIVSVRRSPSPSTLPRRLLPRDIANLLRFLRYRRFRGTMSLLSRKWFKGPRLTAVSQGIEVSEMPTEDTTPSKYVVAVEYVARLTLGHPEHQSNLFFWQQSTLAGSDMMVAFSASNSPLDERVQSELNEHGMAAVVTQHGATTLATVPVFSGPPYSRQAEIRNPSISRTGLESKWLTENFSEYTRLREYWTALFKAHNIRIFVTYNQHDAPYCAISDALESLGGITINYERSHMVSPSLVLAGTADVMFNVSQASVDLGIRSESDAKYHVVTGFLGDHRFSMLEDSARNIRDTLREQGAKHIIAFFDENSSDDPRWSLDHQSMQKDYAFLLEKVLMEPWFGLVIKAKIPSTLRGRLGPVSDLLQQAEATGRCFLFESGTITGWAPPSAGALAADIAVHGHPIGGSTAGLEAALAGVPTLLLDREGWQLEPLYVLGEGRVIFKDWKGLWEACTQHWTSPGGLPGFGDWSPMLDELDPFRDGHAAERMGTYIKWLLEGLRDGLDRETVMAEAAERYCASWGQDKVTIPGSGPQLESKTLEASRVTSGG